MRLGFSFNIITPGFDAQGRKRAGWFQFIHEGTPIFEDKMANTIAVAVARFNENWAKTIGTDANLAKLALTAVKKARESRFMDGKTGNAPALSLTQDGSREGVVYDK